MKSDTGLYEQAIVLAPASKLSAREAGLEVKKSGGRVCHVFGPRVVIGEVSDESMPKITDAIENAEFMVDAAHLERIPAGVGADLDDIGNLGLKAFALRQSDDYAAAKANRPNAGAAWDHQDGSAPDHDEAGAGEAPAEASAQAAVGTTSERISGSIAVGIIVVSGPGDLAFSAAEQTKVVAEVQNGLSWLGAQNPSGGVSWHYDIHNVTITTPADPAAPNLEAVWRDPAMDSLGYPANWSGVGQYVQDIRNSLGTDWTYVGFFTKYPVSHFAYASIGGPRLVMQYANDGWGPDNIDRVFAHETGHIFQAPDEYASSNCNCGGEWGVYNRPNSNCENCAPGGGVSCIMRSNSWEMCSYTPYHLGFDLGVALHSGSKTYFFAGDQYIRVTRGASGGGTLDPGYPIDISAWNFPGDFGQNGIDTALYSGTKTYFFRGDQYIRVTRGDTGPGTLDPGYPMNISVWNFPGNFGQNGIDAALHSGAKTYFFSGDEYIRVTRGDAGAGTLDPGYPMNISVWNFPGDFGQNGIDAALYSGPKTYFFSGDEYIRVTRGDAGAGTLDPGYPRNISVWNWPAAFENSWL